MPREEELWSPRSVQQTTQRYITVNQTLDQAYRRVTDSVASLRKLHLARASSFSVCVQGKLKMASSRSALLQRVKQAIFLTQCVKNNALDCDVVEALPRWLQRLIALHKRGQMLLTIWPQCDRRRQELGTVACRGGS